MGFRLKPLAFVVAILVAADVRALDVGTPEWGFGGRVVLGQFNPVTVEVMNNGREPYEGNIALMQGRSAVASDVPLIVPNVHLEPGESRKIQFFPYIADVWDEFRLAWGERLEFQVNLRDETTMLRFGRPATVLLREANFPSRLSIGVPTFNEELFPISVPGTDGLKAVVLDHVPRWDNLRTQAFRDWIVAGGEVHLCLDDRGEHPKFSPPLEALNEPLDTVVLGAGRVHRHKLRVPEIDETFLSNVLGVVDPGQEQAEANNRRGYELSTGRTLAPQLRSLTRPDHNWALIYFLSFVYLGVVFPGCWLLGRKRADFRITYPVLIGAVVLFSLAFKMVGQRGYGEETAWNSVSVARPLGEGRWLVQGWNNAFVTEGGEYEFKHNADGLLYSTNNAEDVRNGAIVNRPDGRCTVDIPPFSSQTLLHMGVFQGPKLDIRITSADLSASPPKFQLSVEGDLPATLSASAAYGDSILTVARDGAGLQTLGALPISQALSVNDPYRYNAYGMNDPTTPQAVYAAAEATLKTDALRIETQEDLQTYSLPRDRLRLFIYLPAPAEFLDVAGGPPKRNGWVLYVFDLAVPEASLAAAGP